MSKSPSKVECRLVEVIRSLTSSGEMKVIKSLVSSDATRDKGKLGLGDFGDTRQGKSNT